MPRIQIDIWSQTCSIGCIPGLIASQSVPLTSYWPWNATVLRATCGGALSCSNTNFRPKTPLARGSIWSLRIWMERCLFILPSRITRLHLPLWWISPQTMTGGPQFPWFGRVQSSNSLSPFLRRTWALPSLWYREDLDSSLKMQCLLSMNVTKWVPLVPLTTTSPMHQRSGSRVPAKNVETFASSDEHEWSGSPWQYEANDSFHRVYTSSVYPHASSDQIVLLFIAFHTLCSVHVFSLLLLMDLLSQYDSRLFLIYFCIYSAPL